MLRLRAFPAGFSAILGVLLALAALPAFALDPHTALAHYGYQSWQTDSGLPQSTVHAIVQARDGFLWIATEGGLVRFDGAEFAVFNHANTPALPSDLIDGLTDDATGALWISTSGGLAVLRNGRIERFGPEHGVPATQIWRTWCDTSSEAPESERGSVWVLSAAGLFRIDRGASHAVAVPLGQYNLTESSAMAAGPHGTLWLGAEQGLMRASAGQGFRPVGIAGEVHALAVDGSGMAWAGLRSGLEACSTTACRTVDVPGTVQMLAADGSGRIWIATASGLYVAGSEGVRAVGAATGAVTFLFCDREGMMWAATAQGLMRITPDGNSSALPRETESILAAAEDREGDLWLGTASSGLAVLRDRKFFTLTAQEGLTQENVLALAQSPDGDVAAGTNGGGLNVWHQGHFHAVTTAQGLDSNIVLALAADANGDVWVGTPDGLDLVRGSNVDSYTTADGLADDFIRSLHFGPHGALWIGTSHGLSRYANGTFTTWTTLDGLGSDLIGAMANDRVGNLWIGTRGGLTRYRNGQFRNFTTKDGLSSDVVTSLYADREGTLWIGTNDAGLDRMADGHIVAVKSDELPQRVLGILEDSRAYLWLSSNSGVYRVSRAGLIAISAGKASPDPVMRFGVTDGMRISECSSGGHPAALRLSDGTLWFATLKGIAVVDPAQMPLNQIPPLVAIEQVSVDDVPQSLTAALRIKPGHSHYEFDYAGLSFVAPQKVDYRYQLVGFDPGWVDAGTRRAAYYTNLPHGHYVFRVMARNNDAVWSTAPATTKLVVEPHLYQLLWFQFLLALALLGLGYEAWRRRLERVEREFQAVLAERTRIAREIHDTLAQGFVALSVQLELIGRFMDSSTLLAREQLARAQTLVRIGLEEARASIWELRSQAAVREDLATRVLKMAEEVVGVSHAKAKVHMQVSGAFHPLETAVERETLRIAREAVVNAVRHGEPENIRLRLEFEGSIFGMEILDDGRGFGGDPPDGSSGHFGVTGMRERATSIGGTLILESSPGKGTSVRLTVPLAGISAEPTEPAAFVTDQADTEPTETEKTGQA